MVQNRVQSACGEVGWLWEGWRNLEKSAEIENAMLDTRSWSIHRFWLLLKRTWDERLGPAWRRG